MSPVLPLVTSALAALLTALPVWALDRSEGAGAQPRDGGGPVVLSAPAQEPVPGLIRLPPDPEDPLLPDLGHPVFRDRRLPLLE